MRFWMREIAGWLLVAMGLYVFYLCYRMLLAQQLIQTGPMTIIGIFLFRGGIHLIKVAVAAQVCMDADRRLAGKPAAGRAGPLKSVR
jgi:hypothetical protein